MTTRTCLPVLVALMVLGAPLSARSAENAFCVTNADPEYAHRILWMHGDYDFEIHSALAQPGDRVCFESEFLSGQGWYAKIVVKLYEDKAQTAGQVYRSDAADLGQVDNSARVEYCFRFDNSRFVYLFERGSCS